MSGGLTEIQRHRLDEISRMMRGRDFSAWTIKPNADGTIDVVIDIPTPKGFYDGCAAELKQGMITKGYFACWHCPAFGKVEVASIKDLRCRDIAHTARRN